MTNYPGPQYLLCGEPDEDISPIRARCDCGAFISQAPEEHQVQVGPEEYEVDWMWTCKRCGKVFSHLDM